MNATIVHAVVIVAVVAAATTLRALNMLDTQTVTLVYGAALGFAGARATAVPATTPQAPAVAPVPPKEQP